LLTASIYFIILILIKVYSGGRIIFVEKDYNKN